MTNTTFNKSKISISIEKSALLTNCSIENSRSGNRIQSPNVTVINSIFKNNSWIGISFAGNNNISIINSLFANNTLGLYINNYNNVTIIGSKFINNRDKGSFFYLNFYSNLSIINSIFDGNNYGLYIYE